MRAEPMTFRCRTCGCEFESYAPVAYYCAKHSRHLSRLARMSDEQLAEYRERKREHGREWYASNREEVVQYHKDNADHIREVRRRYYQNNRERLLAEKRERYAANVEEERERGREYYAANREKYAERQRRRRARLQAEKVLTEPTKQQKPVDPPKPTRPKPEPKPKPQKQAMPKPEPKPKPKMEPKPVKAEEPKKKTEHRRVVALDTYQECGAVPDLVYECRRLRVKSSEPIQCGRWGACNGCEHCPPGRRRLRPQFVWESM